MTLSRSETILAAIEAAPCWPDCPASSLVRKS